jgi:hypothetical protein
MIGVPEQPELSYGRQSRASGMGMASNRRTVSPDNSIGVYIVHCFTSVI